MKSENGSFFFHGIDQDQNLTHAGKSQESLKEGLSLSSSPENDSLFPFGSCFIHHSGRQFACVYDHCHDHTHCFRNELAIENIDYHALRFHSADRKLWCEQVFPDILRFAEELSVHDTRDYRFSFNHRYIRPDGSVSQFLHEGTLSVKGRKSMPMLTLKVFTEIGDIKTDDTMVLSIFMHTADWGFQKVFNKVYPNAQNSLLSPRELEIIRLCHEGLSSKMIAEKLKLSIHTVKNHKRNSMEKTFTHNITELIHLCIQNCWL